MASKGRSDHLCYFSFFTFILRTRFRRDRRGPSGGAHYGKNNALNAEGREREKLRTSNSALNFCFRWEVVRALPVLMLLLVASYFLCFLEALIIEAFGSLRKGSRAWIDTMWYGLLAHFDRICLQGSNLD